MTLEEFIEKVEYHHCEWYRTQKGHIRTMSLDRVGWEFCPITWVCYRETGKIYDTYRSIEAARDLHLRSWDRRALDEVADYYYTYGDPLATRLLKACGLKEGL